MRDLDWIRRNIVPNERASLTDITESLSVVSIMGPSARKLLQRVTEVNLSNEQFPFGTSQIIEVGNASARAIRITYVGELGWELHVPSSQAGLLYDTLLEAGQGLGLVNAGHYAINSLRLEKGYRAWGADISPDDTAYEAGLGFALNWKKSIPFLGRDTLLKQKEQGLQRQLVTFFCRTPHQCCGAVNQFSETTSL